MSRQSFEEFVFSFQDLDSTLMKELKKILVSSSLKMERDAKFNATTYPRVRTGRLRSSISGFTTMKMGESRVFLRAGGNVDGFDVNYARAIEQGTDRIAPRLYLGRSFDKELKRLPDRLSDLLGASLGVDK